MYCTQGINAYINTNPPLQPEFKLIDTKPGLWEPLDVMIWGKVMSVGLSGTVQRITLNRANLLQKMSTRRSLDILSSP